MALQPVRTAESRQQDGTRSAADSVAEERWARLPDDFVLGEGGQIVPQRKALATTGVPEGSTGEPKPIDNHFSGGASQDAPKCGPSPLPPEEITRLVIEAAQRHKVDVGFAVAVVTAESRLDRLRNSPRGARGPMQLMPQTAGRFGVADICDPEENIDGGVRYLRELTDEFRNPLLVAAAYNAGEGSVRAHGGIPPFKETLGYIAEILNIQLGLDGSSASKQRRAPDAAELSSNVSGVITVRERRQWLGGVMHF
ncbi:lytic transglycosylase domain-containing protein [Tianweitania sediminis]|uniref:Lytic transglycosylase domain-containing protein n=1 Tax=Tianweitania sediminis TaxID=1502156 RepID=A0A8J7R0R1_9HYPH|nr:lytic transglycosylase domain-containing protein [Tianweitania sediminis]